jgi:peptidoglycan hydrolase-like protein with peptidoglycan-binding domain
MPEAQKQSIIQLGIYIKNKYGISRIGGHSEFFKTSCPGTNYPLSQIVGSIMGGTIPSISNNTSSSSSTVFTPNGSIKQLQELIGANPDGKPGPETLGKCPLLVRGSSGNVVKWLQYCLNSPTILGAKLGMDGQYGGMTQIAVQNYQAKVRIAADGKFGQMSWSKLLRLS